MKCPKCGSYSLYLFEDVIGCNECDFRVSTKAELNIDSSGVVKVPKLTKVLTADEMFAELGYKNRDFGDEISYRHKYNNGKRIVFNKKAKTVRSYDNDGHCGIIFVEELKAIHKKIEELGWE